VIVQHHRGGAGGQIGVRARGEEEQHHRLVLQHDEQHAAVELEIDLADFPAHLPVTVEHLADDLAQLLGPHVGERHLPVDGVATFEEHHARDAVEALQRGGGGDGTGLKLMDGVRVISVPGIRAPA
jgi:hypothetical protein